MISTKTFQSEITSVLKERRKFREQVTTLMGYYHIQAARISNSSWSTRYKIKKLLRFKNLIDEEIVRLLTVDNPERSE